MTDAGGRELQAEAVITVIPLNAESTVSMTGPFGATSIAAPTVSCRLTGSGARSGCTENGDAEVPAETQGAVTWSPAAAPSSGPS